MARQSSLIKINGTLEDLTFFKSADGHMVRMKGGVSGDRIKNDPAFARTRENMQEFGEMGRTGKLIRTSLRNVISNGSDPRSASRLLKSLSQVLKEDTTSLRGLRKVGIGLSTSEGKALLVGFNFNIRSVLTQVLKSVFTIDEPTGKVTIANFIPKQDLLFPTGATHCSLECGWSNIDFTTNEVKSSSSPESQFLIDLTSTNVVLSPTIAPAGSGITFIVLKVSFLQNLNGQLYPLQNGGHNAIQLVHVS